MVCPLQRVIDVPPPGVPFRDPKRLLNYGLFFLLWVLVFWSCKRIIPCMQHLRRAKVPLLK